MSQTTERAIAAALKKLLQQKPLNKITISDIAGECGINRMTFYYHFKDIYDLIEWMTTEMTERAVEGNATVDNWTQGMMNLLNAMLQEKTFLLGIYHSVSREQVEIYCYRVLESLFRSGINDMSEGMNVTEEDKQFLIDFYKYAVSGMLLQWVGRGMKDDPKEFVAKTATLIKGDFQRGLERFSRAEAEQT